MDSINTHAFCLQAFRSADCQNAGQQTTVVSAGFPLVTGADINVPRLWWLELLTHINSETHPGSNTSSYNTDLSQIGEVLSQIARNPWTPGSMLTRGFGKRITGHQHRRVSHSSQSQRRVRARGAWGDRELGHSSRPGHLASLTKSRTKISHNFVVFCYSWKFATIHKN